MYITIAEQTYDYPKGTYVRDIIMKQNDHHNIYAVVYNGKLADYHTRLQTEGTLSFIYHDSETGKQIYQRTLNFLFIAAVKKHYPKASVQIQHSLANGHYCEILHDYYVTPNDIVRIEETMRDMVCEAIPIEKHRMSTVEAVAYFETRQMHDCAQLLKKRTSKTSNMYRLCDTEGYFYGLLLPNTSFLDHFTLRFYAPGVWLSMFPWTHDQPKLFQVFQEFESWGRLIGVSNVAQLNQRVHNGDMNDLVLMSETMMEKKLAELTNAIVQDHSSVRFILIAGPSSVGKTSFSKRLAIHLKIHGKHPIAISMDDFYKNREECPKLPDGSYDFEGIEAIDLELFNQTMLQCLHGEVIQLPHFNFKTGLREWSDQRVVLEKDTILIIEGIHGLNPQASICLPNNAKFRIYMNALTHLNLDGHNPLPTSDYRLIRRIVRDYQFRGWSASNTIHFWNNVKAGEEKNIYPYQEEADVIFNSSMVYEMTLLKKLAIPLLQEVKKKEPQFLEANRLRSLLTYFEDGDEEAVPKSSILAEFIGNSVFDVS